LAKFAYGKLDVESQQPLASEAFSKSLSTMGLQRYDLDAIDETLKMEKGLYRAKNL